MHNQGARCVVAPLISDSIESTKLNSTQYEHGLLRLKENRRVWSKITAHALGVGVGVPYPDPRPLD